MGVKEITYPKLDGAVIKDANGKKVIICKKCSMEVSGHMTSHFDGLTTYGYTFECKCGNKITVTYKREFFIPF